MASTFRTVVTAAMSAALVIWSAASHAGTTTYTLNRSSLVDVDDTAGTTQQEGGTFKNASGVALGDYNITRRYTQGGSSGLSATSTTVTLFFAAKSDPPISIVAEGAHSFNNGRFTGSVSAASPIYRFVRGADASYTAPTLNVERLVLSWTGSQSLP